MSCDNDRCKNGWFYWNGSEYPCNCQSLPKVNKELLLSPEADAHLDRVIQEDGGPTDQELVEFRDALHAKTKS